jgi:hypothetical protein
MFLNQLSTIMNATNKIDLHWVFQKVINNTVIFWFKEKNSNIDFQYKIKVKKWFEKKTKKILLLITSQVPHCDGHNCDHL